MTTIHILLLALAIGIAIAKIVVIIKRKRKIKTETIMFNAIKSVVASIESETGAKVSIVELKSKKEIEKHPDFKTEKWFNNRIGKVVYNYIETFDCLCTECTDIIQNGVLIENEQKALQQHGCLILLLLRNVKVKVFDNKKEYTDYIDKIHPFQNLNQLLKQVETRTIKELNIIEYNLIIHQEKYSVSEQEIARTRIDELLTELNDK